MNDPTDKRDARVLQIPAIIESFRSRKDGTYSMIVATQELSPEHVAEIALRVNKFGNMFFAEDDSDGESEIG
jgi:hypothetical protein